jgi:hypothetical protein
VTPEDGRIRPRDILALAVGWIASRLVVIGLVAALPSARDALLASDLGVYWYAATSSRPVSEELPEYPGLARLVLSSGALFDSLASFAVAWLALMLILDAALTLHLARQSIRSAWTWVVGAAALGPLVWLRFDLLVACVVIIAVTIRLRHPVAAGAALGVAVLLKAWPLVLVASLVIGPRWRRWASGLVLVLAIGVLVDFANAGLRSLESPWGNQASRGTQVEAVMATPRLLAHAGDDPSEVIQFTSRAYHLVNGVPTLVTIVGAVALAAIVGFVLLRTHAVRHQVRTHDYAVAAALLATSAVVVNSVYSPQYVLWFLPLVALAAADRSLPAFLSVLTVGIALLTQIIYPWTYRSVVELEPGALLLLAARNVMTIVLAVLLAWHIVRTAEGATGSEPTSFGSSVDAPVSRS